MKHIFLLITMLVSFTLKAQKTKRANQILISYNFSGDYNYRTLKNSDGSSSAGLVIGSRKDIENSKFGYTTGVHICFNFSKPVALETGIQFTNKGYQTKNQDLVFFPSNSTAPTKEKFIYAYQYIGIPLKAKFSFGKGNIRFVTGIGFTTSLLLNYKQTATFVYADGSTEKRRSSSTSGFNKVDLSPMISVGADYRLNNKVHLFAEPTFRYGLIKTKDAPVIEKLWNAGLNIGFHYVVK